MAYRRRGTADLENADHMTSRRTNVSGRALIFSSLVIIFGNLSSKVVSKFIEPAPSAQLYEAPEILLLSTIILILLSVIHYFNWRPDYDRYVMLSKISAKPPADEKLITSYKHLTCFPKTGPF